ncbi:ClC family H(+)/Cl(-) exchange transporter [Candidatus Stoquefichus massiliensis]|uniref:ClC family H(+)/Cl(-) exchange transporter n=1 Tax=Candidatus Stoquefichus massiliensis TaxID=1470350 RepID=UPI0004870A21|nr:ClC family H(+)/Cl(-) exchange transporter [Candidatus Stoquefichus massiliensis]
MDKKDSETLHILRERSHLSSRLFFEGLLVGALAGLIAIIYRLLLTNAEDVYFYFIHMVRGHIIWICCWLLGLIAIGFVISLFLKYEPYISGSGIPQVEAEVQGEIDQCWYKVIVTKMIAGTLCIVGGLSLGREGPSIQLGAMIGKGVSRFFKRIKTEERFLLTCGAAAGLSAAFNAPLAGIMFALEEVHKNFSTSALVSVMCASITGDFISRNVFGLSPSLHFTMENTLPLNQYGWLLILGIATGLLGAFYNKMTMTTLHLYDRIPLLKSHQKVIIPLFISGILGLFIPEVIGGGHVLVNYLNSQNVVLSTLIILLVVKFIFSMLSFGSGAPGGIFFPLLILGSLIGAVFGQLAMMCGVDEIYFVNFIIFAMAGFFAGIVRAPITGIVLIAEMCGTLKLLLPIAAVSFIAYIVANSIGSVPIYESLLHRLTKNKVSVDYVENKELISFVVSLGSIAVDQTVASLKLPPHCLLVSIVRGKSEIIPHGNTKFYVGDQVIIIVDRYRIEESKEELSEIFTFS